MELYGTEGSLFVPDPNFFGGTVELAGRDGRITPVAPWDHPFGMPNQDHRAGRAMANYRTAGLADMAAAHRRRARPALLAGAHAARGRGDDGGA